jgi:hypothetical protein
LLLVLLRDNGIGLASSDCLLRTPNAFFSLKPLEELVGGFTAEDKGVDVGIAGG